MKMETFHQNRIDSMTDAMTKLYILQGLHPEIWNLPRVVKFIYERMNVSELHDEHFNNLIERIQNNNFIYDKPIDDETVKYAKSIADECVHIQLDD